MAPFCSVAVISSGGNRAPGSTPKRSAIKRMVTVDEISALTLLLVSDLGGGINGANLAIDGGTAL